MRIQPLTSCVDEALTWNDWANKEECKAFQAGVLLKALESIQIRAGAAGTAVATVVVEEV